MNTAKRIHFLGICGVGMAAGAMLMREKGFHVTGSDHGAYPPMSTYLKRQGIDFTDRFDPSNMTPPPDLVVVGNALSRGNPELEVLLDLRVPYVSLPELLKKELIRGKRPLVVTGTHGKTTCTSLLAWTLEASGRDPSFFVGGIPRNFARPVKSGEGREVVVEGDEYDSAFFDKRPKFLHYSPDLMIVTSIEYDHADIYPDLEAIEKAFASAHRLIPRRGVVVANGDDPAVRRAFKQDFCSIEWFGLGKEALWQVRDVEPRGEGIAFSLSHEGQAMGPLYLPMIGEHNALNGAAVYVACRWLGLSHEEISRGFETFRGVHRRIEKMGVFRRVTIYDDFAHHPTSVAKTLASIAAHHPRHPIWAVFEPRSNTMRRNCFQGELARAFQTASEVIIGPVYGEARIDPFQRLDPNKLCRDIQRECSARARHIRNVDAIASFLSNHLQGGEIIVVMSSGGFDGLTDKLIRRLEEPRRRA